ncbi:hypothetical protein DRO69_00135 [Candidatus Bathyarchaeota archaeon]|nr:MAG: hypothetical protein DRO69_00135 [Candidatus Bathyarchaeota archaeon]
MFLELYLRTMHEDPLSKAGHIDFLAQVEIVAQLKLLRVLANTIYDCKAENIPKKQLLEVLGRIYDDLTEHLDSIICKDFPTMQPIEVPKEEKQTKP